MRLAPYFAALLLVALAACAGETAAPTAAPLPTQTPEPTATPVPVPTATPTRVPTATLAFGPASQTIPAASCPEL